MALSNSAVAVNAQNALALFKGETVERYAEGIVLNTPAGRPSGGGDEAANSESPNQQLATSNYQLNNYPNPFNNNTVIEVSIPVNTTGQLVVTDVTGKQLKKIVLNQANNQIELKGADLGYGIFFYSLYINGKFVQTKKMIRMR